jgi:hypothetical protein
MSKNISISFDFFLRTYKTTIFDTRTLFDMGFLEKPQTVTPLPSSQNVFTVFSSM